MAMTNDPRDLERFVQAQAPVYAAVTAELRSGRKASHWMWFIFPQVAGLGFSAMSRRYAITSAAEAAAYLAHPLLGPRLQDCTALALGAPGSAHAVFGDPDTAKFHSSLTLFAAVAGPDSVFAQALQRFFGGHPDPATLARL